MFLFLFFSVILLKRKELLMDKARLIEVKNYLEKNKALSNYFRNYSRMYMMTTENLNGFFNHFSVEGKSILTVAGSGDQRLNSYILGAKDVTCFDINPLTELHLKLKDTAIKNIDLDKFISFFEIKNDNKEYSSLDPRIFRMFKDYLDEDVYSFYNYVINESIYLRSRDIYIDFINDISNQKRINNYLDLDSYNNIRNIIRNKSIDFIESNVIDLPCKLDGKKYDMILLSNISDYIHHIYNDNHMSKYKELIDSLKNNLTEDGIMQVGYIYSYYNRGEDISDFHYDDIRNKYFSIGEYLTRFVDSYYNDGSYDKVIIYKK